MWRHTKNEYHNQRGGLIAKNYSWSLRTERKTTRERGKYSQIELPHPWTDEQLAKIEEDALAEKIRGAEVRYWENTEIGEELPLLIKGPFGLTDMVAFCVGFFALGAGAGWESSVYQQASVLFCAGIVII